MSTQPYLDRLAAKRSADSTDESRSTVKQAWVLTYHEVEPAKSNYLYAVTAQQLEEQLRMIATRKKQHGDATEITFDDGHVSNIEVAEPLLEKHGLKARFFVSAGRIKPQTMTWPEMRELVQRGHSIQSHGWSHKFLAQCSPIELREELSRSKGELETHVGTLVDEISVPGGRWNMKVLQAAAKVGYRRVYTSDFWSKRESRGGVDLIGRFMVRSDMNLAQIERWISTDVNSLKSLRAKQAIKKTIRRMTGDQLYHKVWCWLAVSAQAAADEQSGVSETR